MNHEDFTGLLQDALCNLLSAVRQSPEIIPPGRTADDIRLYASAVSQLDWAIDATQRAISKFEELSKRQPTEGGG